VERLLTHTLDNDIKYGIEFAYTSSMRVPFNSMDRSSLLLMDELWQKNGKAKKAKSNPLDDILQPNASNNKLEEPDWNRIPTKGVAMSEEEFEEKIKALAMKAAEKGMDLKDRGKGMEAFRFEEWNLFTKYISVVSPDRKMAYEMNKNSDVIYGNGKQETMKHAGGYWSARYTNEELTRCSKFYGIYNDTIKEYEAEHGEIPAPQKKTTSASVNQYQVLAEFAAYNRYLKMNFLA
jgi:hypothetical protein